MKHIILILISIGAVLGKIDVNVNLVHTCTERTANGMCNVVETKGEIKEDGCFPGNAKVLTQYGECDMSELQIGDKILGLDGTQLVYTPVTAWLHREPGAYLWYAEVVTSGGKIWGHTTHNVAIACQPSSLEGICYKMIFALEPDNALVVLDESRQSINDTRVLSLTQEHVLLRGLYAPFTAASTYFVRTSDGPYVLAHAFSDVEEPQKYEALYAALVSGYNGIFGSKATTSRASGTQEAQTQHPVTAALTGVKHLYRNALRALSSGSANRKKKQQTDTHQFMQNLVTSNIQVALNMLDEFVDEEENNNR